MRTLAWELKELCERNRDGSFGTQTMRSYLLALMAEQLWQMGFKDVHADGLKGRHVTRLLRKWQEEGLSAGSIKNRMSALRWALAKFGHEHYIPRTNAALGIPKREGVSRVSKALDLMPEQILGIRDRYVQMSVRLQKAFGLRREESIKMKPALADKGDILYLQASWCKGGRSREVPIVTEQQRVVLNQAHALARTGSLIPKGKTYVQQLRVYEAEMKRLGIYKPHGLRHAYAQKRYQNLSGMISPVNTEKKELTSDEWEKDHKARMQLTKELGHGRKSITSAYLGAISRRKKKDIC